MEELKNENVVEQRPSTKYGRTAYQQQLQAEQEAQRMQAESVEQNRQQETQPYQQYNAYTMYEEVKPNVKPVYATVLMVIVALAQMINFAINLIASKAYGMGETIEEIVDATLVIAQEPEMLVLSTISDLLFGITVILITMDVIQLRKAGKKTGGAIAFAVFLRPAYFIWRAYLLGEKKVIPIIYAVIVYMISFAQYYVLLSASMEMVMRTMY